ncbi:MAG: N-succinylarginine dihydrolase [Pirellulales bacterium]
MLIEINIDGMIGPTHHYGGLGVGNLASLAHRFQASNPRQAALEGLTKAKLVSDLGIPQFLWLPPQRPNLDLLQSFGFRGSVHEQIKEAFQTAPRVLSAVFSGAFMWAANSATVTPAVDAQDKRYHFTPANLISSLHRSCEASERKSSIENTFSCVDFHLHHKPLPYCVSLRDEGAANHMRLSDPTGEIGFNIFVFGEDDSPQDGTHSEQNRKGSRTFSKFLPRQTKLASETIARQHRLNPDTTFFLKQHPAAIEAGVFHNDVIATSHENVLLHHEFAFIDADEELSRLERAFESRTGRPLIRVMVPNSTVSLEDSVQSYLFNSQLLTPQLSGSHPKSSHEKSPRMIFLCPMQCQQIDSVKRFLNAFIASSDNPVDEVRYVSVGQSMAGGGGPACLRLRVPADQPTLDQLPSFGKLTNKLDDTLLAVVEKHYPAYLTLESFCDVDFIDHLKTIDVELERAYYGARLDQQTE